MDVVYVTLYNIAAQNTCRMPHSSSLASSTLHCVAPDYLSIGLECCFELKRTIKVRKKFYLNTTSCEYYIWYSPSAREFNNVIGQLNFEAGTPVGC